MTWSPMIVVWFVIQLVLLGLELFMKYDTFGRQNALALTNVAVMVAVVLLPWRLGGNKMRISGLTLAMVTVALWLDAFGNFQHLYGTVVWWDRFTHFVGGMAISSFLIDLCLGVNAAKLKIGTGLVIIFAFLLGQFIGGLYEISEYLGDMWFQTGRVGERFDSARDLLFNLLGGLAVLALAQIRIQSWHRERKVV